MSNLFYRLLAILSLMNSFVFVFLSINIANATIIKTTNPAFIVSVVKNGNIIFSENIGFDDKMGPVSKTTMFPLNSMSKQFTAAAILLLAEREMLNLNDQVKVFFPDLADQLKNITILDLIAHSGGVPDYLNSINIDDFFNNNKIIDNNFVIKYLSNKKFNKPGKHNYSNSGYVLLSMIVEKISGLTFANFIKDNIFNKNNMNNTFFIDKNNRCSVGHLSWPVFSDMHRDLTNFTTGDLGICSNMQDYIKWLNAIDNNKIFKTKEYHDMFIKPIKINNQYININSIINVDQAKYGYGWRHGFLYGKHAIMWHFGNLGGHRSMVVKLIEKDLWFVFFANADINDIADFGFKVSMELIKNNYE